MIKKNIFKRIDLLILVFFVGLIRFPYFPDQYLPKHDTMYGFELFHFFFREGSFVCQISAQCLLRAEGLEMPLVGSLNHFPHFRNIGFGMEEGEDGGTEFVGDG